MSTLADLTSVAARILGNMVMTKANAVIGATASAITTGNAITTVIDGVARNLAALTNQALTALTGVANWLQPSGIDGFYVQPAGTTVYYVVCVDSSGTVRVVQGLYDGQLLSSQGLTVVGKSVIPTPPAGWVPFAVIKVASGGSAFTPGTTALTSIATIYDVTVLPSAATL